MHGFQFKLDGKKETVLKSLVEQREKPLCEKPEVLDAVKVCIQKLIDILEVKHDGVMVVASGDFSKQTGRFTASIQVFGKSL